MPDPVEEYLNTLPQNVRVARRWKSNDVKNTPATSSIFLETETVRPTCRHAASGLCKQPGQGNDVRTPKCCNSMAASTACRNGPGHMYSSECSVTPKPTDQNVDVCNESEVSAMCENDRRSDFDMPKNMVNTASAAANEHEAILENCKAEVLSSDRRRLSRSVPQDTASERNNLCHSCISAERGSMHEHWSNKRASDNADPSESSCSSVNRCGRKRKFSETVSSGVANTCQKSKMGNMEQTDDQRDSQNSQEYPELTTNATDVRIIVGPSCAKKSKNPSAFKSRKTLETTLAQERFSATNNSKCVFMIVIHVIFAAVFH